MVERWLPVVGFERYYEVSDWGRVKSCARVVVRPDGVAQSLRERILVQTPDKRGHLNVGLHREGRVITRKVHRLVLEAFVGPCPEGMECLHGPGGAGDNRLENLKWGTPKENQADRVRDGTSNRGGAVRGRETNRRSGPRDQVSVHRGSWRTDSSCTRIWCRSEDHQPHRTQPQLGVVGKGELDGAQVEGFGWR